MNRNDVKILKKYLKRRYIDFHDTSVIHNFKNLGLIISFPEMSLHYKKGISVAFAQTSEEGIVIYKMYKYKLIPIIGRLFK